MRTHTETAAALSRCPALPGVTLRPWAVTDVSAIQVLSAAEGWPTLTMRPAASLIAEADGMVIGFLRALSDGAVTTSVAEVLVAPAWRGHSPGAAPPDPAAPAGP